MIRNERRLLPPPAIIRRGLNSLLGKTAQPVFPTCAKLLKKVDYFWNFKCGAVSPPV
jgi:hypothetical protein